MRIAVQAADLDAKRIDGTRVYILNLLKHFGQIDPESRFLIYHKKKFNPELAPPDFSNYEIKAKNFPFFWTQTRFSFELWKDRPDVLWMPMHNIPLIKKRGLKTVVTIHDLAFKHFPESFTKSDLRNLNLLADLSVRKSDKIIAVSNSTKKDILDFYPDIQEKKIRVIHHGFDSELFQHKHSPEEILKVCSKHKIPDAKYLLYVGAVQPRKNLTVLVEAFERVKKRGAYKDLRLVLAGSPAWMAEKTLERIGKSKNKKDIILTGRVSFSDLAKLYQGAEVFVFPSLYEGFGIPILEAFASGVPVICAQNSSLPEVGDEVCLYFDPRNPEELAEKIKEVLESDTLKESLVKKGLGRVDNFSWEKCARETLDYIKS